MDVTQGKTGEGQDSSEMGSEDGSLLEAGLTKSAGRTRAAPSGKPQGRKSKGRKRAKGKRPNRKKFKTQLTVRVEDWVKRACLVRGEAEGFTLTDVVEFALHEWLARKNEPDSVLTFRLVATRVSLPYQKRGLGFLVYEHYEPQTPLEREVRRFIDHTLDNFMERSDYAAIAEEMQRQLVAGAASA